MNSKTPLNVTKNSGRPADDAGVETMVTMVNGSYQFYARYREQPDDNTERKLAKAAKERSQKLVLKKAVIVRKDITRFLPLWAIYTVGMLLAMLSQVPLQGGAGRDAIYAVRATIGPMSIVNLCYALLAAQLLFGELFDARLCNALHAMPVRREVRFGSHVLTGLGFSIVPNLLVALVITLFVGYWGYTASWWLLAMTLQYLFFFGVAVLSMFCTGNRAAAALVYGLINFGAMGVLWLLDAILAPVMHGVVLTGESFYYVSPPVWMYTVDGYYNVLWGTYFKDAYVFVPLEGWSYLWGCAGIGAVSLVTALLLYRRRKLESAGTFMAVKVLKPVFLVVYTLCVGALLTMLNSAIGGNAYLIFLAVGLVIGFFTGKMFLERTVRVFRWKSFLQLGILAAAMAAVMLTAWMDPWNIARYVPDAKDVAKAEIVTYDGGRQELRTTEFEKLKTLQLAHEFALEEYGTAENGVTYYITYHMKDGSVLKRQYTVSATGDAGGKFQKLITSPEAILGMNDGKKEYPDSVTDIQITGLALSIEGHYGWSYNLKADLIDAIYADLTVQQNSEKIRTPGRYTVSFWHDAKKLEFTVYEGSFTERYLEQEQRNALGDFFWTVTSWTVEHNGKTVEIDTEDYSNLSILESYHDDCTSKGLAWDWDGDEKNAVFIMTIRTESGETRVLYISESMYNSCSRLTELLGEQS